MVIGAIMLWSQAQSYGPTSSILLVPREAFGPKSQSVEQYVREYFSDTPILIEIARCESQFRQYDSNGKVLRGEAVNDDIGIMQVNDYYHKARAAALDMDIRTIDGNLAYALYLFEEEGTAPWSASKKCWKPSSKVLARAK